MATKSNDNQTFAGRRDDKSGVKFVHTGCAATCDTVAALAV